VVSLRSTKDGKMQWRAAPLILAAVFAQSDPSLGAGAIAVGQPDDVAKRVISMGLSTNRETTDEAKSRSMILCKNSGTLASSILCQVVATFENKCVAVAIDPQAQTPGFGWAVADTEQLAKKTMRCLIVGRQRGRPVRTPARLLIATVTAQQKAMQINLVRTPDVELVR
jgi:Domain of unknown function (DUF4189)